MKRALKIFLFPVLFFLFVLIQIPVRSDVPLELEVEEGDLVMYYIDEVGGYVFEPMVVVFTPVDSSFEFEESKGTLGTSSQRLRVDNASSGEAELSIGLYVANFENDAKWIDGEKSYLAYSTDGLEGGLLVDPSEIDIDDDNCGGVTNNVFTPNRFTYIDDENPETNILSIDLLNTSGGSECRFDLTNILLTQTVPPRTHAGNYTLGMVLTLTGGEWWSGEPAEWSCGEALVDVRDGNKEYATIEIDGQCWMTENLDYDDGCSTTTWENDVDKGWCGYYIHEDIPQEEYGLLYQWSAAMDEDSVEDGDRMTSVQGICPEGWLLPSDSELHSLELYFTDNGCTDDRTTWGCSPAGDQLKSTNWCNGSPCGESGFEALAGGARSSSGSFSNFGNSTTFWSSSPSGSNAWRRGFVWGNSAIFRGSNSQASGYYVRCLKD
jgi:uncharacterized protein (TIGR02145 family)